MTLLPPALADQLPADVTRQREIIDRLQRQPDLFGYQRVDTPLIEQADLFLIKAGDAAISRLVSFDLPGRTLCLRPEFTAPAARLYIEHYQHLATAVRLQFAGPVVQYESLHHNTIRQQNAIGAELLNENSPAADAEMIALAGKTLEEVGLSDWELVIGHSGLIERLLDRYDLDRQMRRLVLEFLPALRTGPEGLQRSLETLTAETTPIADERFLPLDTLGATEAALRAMVQASPQRGPTGGRTSEEIARRLLGKQQQGDRQQRARIALQRINEVLQHTGTPGELLRHVDSEDMRHLVQELIQTFDLLAAYGIPEQRVRFDLSFTRNLDYYTGIVFEYRTASPEGDLLLGGGGRYDELVRLLGARRDIPAVGFMCYVDHILAALNGEATRDRAARPIHVLAEAVTVADTQPLVILAGVLRRAGIPATLSLRPGRPDADFGGPYTHRLTLEEVDSLRLEVLRTGAALHLSRQQVDQLPELVEKNQ